jgi:hypothetical protein
MPDPIQPEQLLWQFLEHPPYNPDLAPSDFHLFGPLKYNLGDKRFADDEEVAETKIRTLLCCGFRRTNKAMGHVFQC